MPGGRGSAVVDSALLRLYAATFCFVLLMAVGFPLVPQHLDLTFDASVLFIGLVAGLYGFSQIFLRLPMGDLADRKGRKSSLIGTFVISAVAGIFYVFGPSKWWILVGQVLFGLASGIFWVAANSYLFDRVPEEEIPRATSDYALALGAGFLVGPPLGGYLADGWGFAAGLSVYLWASLAGLLLVLTLPETTPSPEASRPEGGVYRRAWRIFRHPDIRFSAFGTFLFGLTVGVLGSFFPVYIRVLGFTALAVGLLISVRQGFSLIARIGLPARIDRHGPRAILLVATTVGALSLALLPFVEDLGWLSGLIPATLTDALGTLGLAEAALSPGQVTALVGLVLLAVVAGLGLGIMVPANLTLVSRGAPPDERGLANGIYGTALGLGTAITSWVLGGVGEVLGIRWTFWASALMIVPMLVGLYLYGRAHPPDQAPAPGSPEHAMVEQE